MVAKYHISTCNTTCSSHVVPSLSTRLEQNFFPSVFSINCLQEVLVNGNHFKIFVDVGIGINMPPASSLKLESYAFPEA